jgi:hypothetical protein
MLHILDVFFLLFHSCLIIFNLLGWIWKPIRLINLITLLLTGSSWFILGLFYGIGYCPLTDWHFQVLEKLGTRNLPDSYIKYLTDRIFGININSVLIDRATMSFFLAALVLSIIFNLRDWRRKSQMRRTF